MLQNQSNLKVKDNSKILKVKIINTYLKKKITFKDIFLGVIKSSKNISLKEGSLNQFLITNTKKGFRNFSGKIKKTDYNACITIKNNKNLDLLGTRFSGFFFSEIKSINIQNLKNVIDSCI